MIFNFLFMIVDYKHNYKYNSISYVEVLYIGETLICLTYSIYGILKITHICLLEYIHVIHAY